MLYRILPCFLVVLAALASAAYAQPRPRAVLIITEADPSSGAPTVFSSTLADVLDDATPFVAVYSETVDLARFSDERQQSILRTYLQAKYRDVKFGAVLAVGASAFALVSRWKSELWPDVPVIFAAVDETTASGFQLDPNTTGLVMRRTLKSMIDAARAVVPGLAGVTIMGGTLSRDAYRRQYMQEISNLTGQIEITNLTGRTLAEQKKLATAVPRNAAILYTSLFIDDEGTRYSSPQALAEIAQVANRPIVIDVESLIGTGATGGFVLNNVSYGREVAALTLRVINGTPPASIPVAFSEFTRPVFDWRQLRRWNIAETALPPHSDIRFRPSNVLEQYYWRILLAGTAIMVQALLITGLIYERRRRHTAEVENRRRIAELAVLNRRAAIGELSASIAHEIKQPLAAIVANSNVGEHWLATTPPNIDEAAISLKQIVDDAYRANKIIESVRGMFKKDGQSRDLVNLNEIVREVLTLLRIELDERHVRVLLGLQDGIPQIVGDRIQLQQVILNLVRNAIEAMSEVSDRARVLKIFSAATDTAEILVRIEDSGPGIDPAIKDSLFEPFVTTKANGSGMGLSVCRSIIKAHGGRLSAGPARPHGASFELALPLPRQAT